MKKFFNWMQNKFNGRRKHPDNKPIPSPTIRTKEEFSKEWMLSIGTLGNTMAPKIHVEEEEDECSSPDLSEFTTDEVNTLQKELKKLLTQKPVADLPLDRFLNCPSSLEVDRIMSMSNRYSTYSDEDEINRTIKIILGRCKDVCEKKKNDKAIGKKSLSFLIKKVFACRGGFTPTPSLRDMFLESRVEKLMRTMLTRKIYPQNASRASSMKRYIEDDHRHASKQEDNQGSKWDKTDSEFIVLEI